MALHCRKVPSFPRPWLLGFIKQHVTTRSQIEIGGSKRERSLALVIINIIGQGMSACNVRIFNVPAYTIQIVLVFIGRSLYGLLHGV